MRVRGEGEGEGEGEGPAMMAHVEPKSGGGGADAGRELGHRDREGRAQREGSRTWVGLGLE